MLDVVMGRLGGGGSIRLHGWCGCHAVTGQWEVTTAQTKKLCNFYYHGKIHNLMNVPHTGHYS